jgi:hypothetical protein
MAYSGTALPFSYMGIFVTDALKGRSGIFSEGSRNGVPERFSWLWHN